MTFPGWRQRLARSLHNNRSQVQSKYLQLASIGLDGKVNNRTVVFRGFNEDNILSAVTDIRSKKFAQLQANNEVELCWYFAGSREQYRLACTTQLYWQSQSDKSANDERIIKDYWHRLSAAAQSQFFGPTPDVPLPTEGLATIDHAANNNANSKQDLHKPEISENFCVMLFAPYSCDYLCLKGASQQRYLSALDSNNKWSETPVNP